MATVRAFPAESTFSYILARIRALLFPTAGLARGLSAIFARAAFEKYPLKRAARPSALCVVAAE